jgi:pantothenate kinase type III
MAAIEVTDKVNTQLAAEIGQNTEWLITQHLPSFCDLRKNAKKTLGDDRYCPASCRSMLGSGACVVITCGSADRWCHFQFSLRYWHIYSRYYARENF